MPGALNVAESAPALTGQVSELDLELAAVKLLG